MSKLLPIIETEFSKIYSESSSSQDALIRKCPLETHDFKAQLKKLKAHLNKHIQESEAHMRGEDKEGDVKKLRRRRELVVEKVNKCHKQWDLSIKKQIKQTSQQHARFKKMVLNKLYEFDLDQICINRLPQDSKKYVDKAISFHISRYNIGNLDIRDRGSMMDYLRNVYGVSEDISSKFVEMGQIVQDMKNGNPNTCLDWCKQGSLLQFELHTLNLMQLFEKGDTLKTYRFLTNDVTVNSFKHRHKQVITEISPILTRLILGKPIMNIKELTQKQLEKCISLFTQEYCSQNNVSFNSPLFLIILSGVIAFQFFIKYTSIRASAHVDWTTENELPFDVQLPDFLSYFNPIFICPVLKEETTEENPPYALPCHHILSKKSLDRLSKNGTSTFKCPYCPVNASKSKTRKVNFVML
ncbi:hypothetical protein HG535_0C01400 [Zygotorulaspora mrakii]|uniref:GID complex catalytic subunit 2 n=1 Tax=Zygotorulaspora mrakii TaxID=42260 RepID=A0A7H9AZK7_ZYGMR|nr:uncharacterized protein HG535_0C01400 [Zygotorulaspora mrakii]QLG71791.1 hypothetical protein HG535_0C01400 [Zygotorulaspora mrakii]